MTHICISDLTSIGSDNGLSSGRCQAIIRTNAGILLIRPLGTNFSEILFEILIFSFKKIRLKVSSAKRRPFCLGLNELMHCGLVTVCVLNPLPHLGLVQVMACCLTIPSHSLINTWRPRPNGRRFADDIFKCTFLNENV